MANWRTRLRATDEGRRHLERERVWIEATEAICELMERQEISKSDLARKLGHSPPYITKLLRGSNNFTLSTLSDVFMALGRSVHITHAPLGDSIRVPSDNEDWVHCLQFEWSVPACVDNSPIIVPALPRVKGHDEGIGIAA